MKNNIFYIAFFILFLSIYRLIPHPPNFTPILASAIMCPLLTRDRLFGAAIPLFAMFISDVFIGFHTYQFVIYKTLISVSLISPIRKNSFLITLTALLACIWFFITTNFAVWLFWDYYPKTLNGLISSYVLAIPFFKNTLISTLLFSGVIYFSMGLLHKASKKTILFLDNIKIPTGL